MRKLLLPLAILTSFVQTANANLIVNGSFEDVSGGIPGETLFAGFEDIDLFDDANQLFGWERYTGTTNTYYAEVRDNQHDGGSLGLAYDGTKFLELDTHDVPNGDYNGGVTQTLTNLAANGTFNLSFWYSPRVWTALFTPLDSNNFDVYWNENLIPSFSNSFTDLQNFTGEHQWVNFSALVTGTASGTNTLSFVAKGTSDVFGASIDNVSLTASVAAVPEPQSYLMFMAGLGLLGLMRKNQKV